MVAKTLYGSTSLVFPLASTITLSSNTFFKTQYSLPPSTFGVNNRRELPVLYYRIYYTGKLYKIDEVRKLGETMD